MMPGAARSIPAYARLARQLRLGRLLYLAWHAPRAVLRRSVREGGPVQQWIDARGRRAMRAAAGQLPSPPPVGANAFEITFLTGRRFWYQTAFCCWSLRRRTAAELRPVFVDDGTIDADVFAEANRLFPGCRVERCGEIERRLESSLPASRFPTLRAHRERFILLRKLTDVHAGREGPRMLLDSDMLFFREPTALIAWLRAPRQPLHMLDVDEAYGYPAATLSELAGQALPLRINTGICGLFSHHIDWQQMESWCEELLRRQGSSYYLEQALTAMCLSRLGELSALPAHEYRVMPDDAECRTPTAVMHHYVDSSKRGYFRHAWRRALVLTGTQP